MRFNEASLESAAIELFKIAGYQYLSGSSIERDKSEVLLKNDLKLYLANRYQSEGITGSEIDSIIRQIEMLPSSSLYQSNKTVCKLLADGFNLKRENRNEKDIYIQYIDFEQPENNTFKIVNQLEIVGFEKRIPDTIIYINGIPVCVIEFKSAVKEDVNIHNAFEQLTIRYKRDIPELFKYNAFCVISDGVNNRAGSIFASYNFFYSWRLIEGSEIKLAVGIDSLYTMVSGLFDKSRLCDVIQNFIYFPDKHKSDVKIVCRYPQYYAARKLYESIKRNMKPGGSGKGGTYFGATGCGKSYTMLYLTR